mgnify:CR=1 FL=1|tara:strand:- start:25 stop:207 length:183 start_codon:yes stop_codon:yes gene_type:complete
MACKKSELVSAINSFASARATGDANLVAFSAQLVQQYVETLEFDDEDEETAEDSDAGSAE